MWVVENKNIFAGPESNERMKAAFGEAGFDDFSADDKQGLLRSCAIG
jgi:hypothetical protein